MPRKTRIGQADVLAGLIADIRNQQDFRKTGEQVLLDDMDFELSEPGAEFDVTLVGELLPSKGDNNVVVKDALDLAECLSVDVPSEIEANFRPAGRTTFLHRWLQRNLPRCDTAAAHVFTRS